jgi:hypothetical protein
LKVDPETAEVSIDSSASDPLPRIIKGIPVHLREARVYTDRPNFILNPTGCKPNAVTASLFGFGSEQATVSTPFQAANCAALPFKPDLKVNLKGGTKRSDFPALSATVTYPKAPYANISRAQVTLPHSEFLEQAHIKTICTRVQFAQGNVPGEKCPPGSIYGSATATTPLLEETLQGPAYLRSSSHNLPDLVIALNSPRINVNVVGRIDSVRNGRIRTTFESVPDAPVSRFTLKMLGGKKGLLVNSTNICRHTNRAIVAFSGHNGKVRNFNPVVKASCGKKSKGSARR